MTTILIDAQTRQTFLTKQLEKMKSYPEATASLLMQMAHYLMADMDDVKQAKLLLEKAESILDEHPGSSFSIHAKLHRTMSEYAKRVCDYTLYYKSSMSMLSCVNLSIFSTQEQEIRGYYICVAALLSDSIYNFGELVRKFFYAPHRWLQYTNSI
jgi:26S proteasome regulatory subunit N9